SKYLSAGVQLKLGFGLGVKNQPPKEEENEVVVEEKVEVQEPEPEPEAIVVAEEKPALTVAEINYIESPLVFGEIDQARVGEHITERLDSIATMVNKHETLRLQITGHTCDLGSDSLNKRVGMKRA